LSIKAGQFLHVGNGFVVDRIQTGGASGLNIPEEQIYEVGNFQAVATIRDIPDLSFDLESLDVSTEIEALLTATDPATVVAGDRFVFTDAVPLDVISPFKSAKGAFDIIRGLAVPYLSLESATYRFGTRANATQAYTLRGDSIYYTQGTPYYQEFAASGAGPYTLAHTALPFMSKGASVYVLSLCYVTSTGTFKRLYYGDDYTNTATTFTLTTAPPGGSTIRAIYASATGTTYPQTVHQGVSVKPAAVRGKDIDVYVGNADATPTFSRWTGVQSFEATWRVTLDNDEEFGNPHYVAQDYDIPEVTGTITVRPRDVDDLWDKIYAVTNVPANEVAGALTSVGLPVELRVYHPETGVRLKTLYIPDARFTPPSVQGRPQTKIEVTFNFRSDTGVLEVYQGNRAGT
jgi:hypothetical protein